ncbi:Integrator complex subunit 7 [Schistosoma japonicum]|nr:Integrator complex subunit 7 [Schistosoma japonicum]
MTFNSHELSESDLGKDASVLIMELNKGFFIVCMSNIFYRLPVNKSWDSINNYLRLCILRACTECRAHFKKLTVCEDIIRKLLPFTESNDPTVRALTLRLFGILNEITRDHLGVHHAILKQIESHYEVESDAAVWACHTIAPISSVFAGSLCPILCKILNNLSIDMDTKLKLLYLGKHMHHNSVVADKIRHCLTQMLETYNTTNFVTGILDTLTVLETRAPLHVPIQIDLLIKRLSIEQRPPLRQSILWNLLTLAENVSHHFDKSHILELSSLYHVKDCSKMDKSLILQIFYCLTTSFHSVEFLTLPSGEFNTVRYYTPVDCIKSALQDDSSSYLLIRAIQLACKLTILKGENDSLKNTADDGSFEFSLDNDSAFQFNPGQFIQLFLYHFNVSVKDDVEECTYNLLVEFFSTFPLYTSKLHKMNFLEGLKLDGTVSTGLLSQFLCTIYAKLSQFLFPNPSMTTEVDTDINSVQLNYVNVLSKLTDSVKIEDSLSSTSSSPSAPTQNCITSVLSTIGLVFQLTGGSPLTQKEQIILVHSVAKCLGEEIVSSTGTSNSSGYRLSPWIVYQLARQANRYGQHEFAGKLYEKLSSLTITEKSHFWLTGLCEFSRMESKLINLTRSLEHDVQETLLIVNSQADSSTHSTTSRKQSWVVKLIQGLRTASEDACKIQTTIMCVGGSDGRWFQANYIQIRSLLLNSLSNLCSTVHHALRIRRWSGSIFMNQSCKSDPSHLQTSQCTLFNMNTPSNVIWLSNCVESWNTLLQEISKLRAQCLDADLETHRHLEAITQLVEFFIEILNLIDGSRYSSKVSSIGEHFSSRNDSNSFQTYESDPYGKIIPILRELMGKLFPDNNSNTPCIREWLPVIIYKVVQIASHWPRFFFQRLQTTTVRLVLLPKAGSNPDDILTISSDICHMIQVMGVVQQRSRLEKQALLRRIKAVQIAINVHEICPETIKTNQFTKTDCIFSTKKIAQLKGDYFHCEFCIRFPQTELNNISSVESVIVTASNRQSDRIFCIHAHPILIDDFGSHWDLSTNAGASDESVLVRVESLPAVASVHTSNPLDQNHHQRMENQETVETPQVIGSHQSASSVSSKDSSSSSHTFHQKITTF